MSRSAPPQRRSLDAFVPSNGDLLIRDNVANGINIPTENYRKSGHLRRPATMGGYRFGKLSMSSFFTRHNPHPRRVNHFKGLLDVPICTVNDYDSAKRSYHLEFPPNGYARDALNLPTECINVNSSQYPMDTLTGLHYFHPLKKLPFGQKQTPQATAAAQKNGAEPWRAELQELAKAAGLTSQAEEPKPVERKRTSQYSAATGRLIPPPTKGLSRSSSRMKTAQFLAQANATGDILGQANVEDTVMMMLCQILQTDDVQAVQQWLGAAGDNEKGMVQELIKAAMSGKSDGYNSQYPVQEYMIGLDGLPMTPDIGTVIGDNVQNRLSTAADDGPPVPEPTMNPPADPGPDVEEVANRINRFSPRIPGRTSLPPIVEMETMANEAPILESFIKDEKKEPLDAMIPVPPTSSNPLPSISAKQQGFNKALENITRTTIEGLTEQKNSPYLKRFTRYPIKTDRNEDKTNLEEIRLKMSSSASQRHVMVDENKLLTKTMTRDQVWKPANATVVQA